LATLTSTGPAFEMVSTSIAQARSRLDDRSTNFHRQLIGCVGLLLPFILIAMALARDGLNQWRNLESISAYYYTGAVTPFVGMLVALGLFLFAYKGYENEYKWADRWAAKTASVASFIVAVYPTKAPEGAPAFRWWTPGMGVAHHVAAIVLFTMFAVFALWLFRLTAHGEQPAADKRWRNRIYLVCGLVIVGCMGWAGFNSLKGRPIFWPESIALIAFALSWLVKGYALRTIVGTARSLVRR
jgi:hypothetical protein